MKKSTLALTMSLLAMDMSQAQSTQTEAPPAPAPFPLGGEDCDDSANALISISPSLHLRAVYGETELEDTGLASGGHDPAKDGFSVPGLSVGADIHLGENLFIFTESIFAWDKDEGWEGELEELYLKWLNIPGGFSLKGGRFFASVGKLNTAHNHEWEFVDTSMMNFRFLGDDALALEGVELTWNPPTRWDDKLILGYGSAIEHDHAHEGEDHDEHGEEEHDEHDEHDEEEHDEHDEEEHDEHGHAEEAEEALWDRDIFTLRYQATFWPADTCGFTYGVSYMQGKNFMGETSELYGADLTYIWLEGGAHGQKFIWTNEAMLRDIVTDEGSFKEWAFSSRAIWKFLPDWEAGLRYDYLEGVADPELPERHRISPALTRYFRIGKGLEAMTRVQYNYDHSEENGEDHSIWLMFGFDWGAGDDHVH